VSLILWQLSKFLKWEGHVMTTRPYAIFGIGVMVLGLTGCDATVELTKAPFDASTALSDGVTRASSELVQPTTEFTSSLTPGVDGLVGPARARKKLEAFTAYSFENVRGDISRGEGEYLVSLGALAGVPNERQEGFRAQMRDNYAALYNANDSNRDAWVRVVNAAWSSGYGQESAQTESVR
jgi:hypothetical protein